MNWGQGPPKVKKFKDYLKGRDRGLPENLLVHSPNGYGGQGGARPKAGASCRSPMCMQGAEVGSPDSKQCPLLRPLPALCLGEQQRAVLILGCLTSVWHNPGSRCHVGHGPMVGRSHCVTLPFK